MSEITYVGARLKSFKADTQFDGYTRVLITAEDGVTYSAGCDLGRTLHIEKPWGSQEIATKILDRI